MQRDCTKAMCVSSCIECLPYCSTCAYMPYCGTCPVINLAQVSESAAQCSYYTILSFIPFVK